MATRKTYSANFKKRVALEAVKEHLPLSQLARKHGVHASQIKVWKDILTKQSVQLFERKNGRSSKGAVEEKKIDELLRIIGKLQVENEFLKKTLG